MGTNRFANQSGMTGFGESTLKNWLKNVVGMPRREITKYKDEVRGEMPHDEASVSRQTSGWKEGASQAGMTGPLIAPISINNILQDLVLSVTTQSSFSKTKTSALKAW